MEILSQSRRDFEAHLRKSSSNRARVKSRYSKTCPEKLLSLFAGNYPRLSHNGFVSIFLCKEP